MELNPPSRQWEQVKNLVLAAQDEAPADLDAWLAAHCPDPATREEVARLLHASATAGDFLEGSASQKHLGLRPLHPARIGRYRIIEELGGGGLGVVYAAQDDLLNRPVAIKVLRLPESPSSELRKRLLWDARAASSLQHPNIVVVHDISQDGNPDFIVMERIFGETLARCLPSGGMEPARALPIALQIARGLEAAHAAGIVHRDLKPSNIMISAGDAVKILDFGLAKPSDRLVQEDSQMPATIEGRFAGTVAYVAPEQADGKPADARADIFSFGCVLYELLSGRQAFEGQSAMSVVARILHHEPPAVGSLISGLDPRLQEIVARCLRKNPDERFQSVSELRERLSECVVPQRFVLPPISWRRTGWKGWAAVAGLLAVACVLTWLAAARFGSRAQEAPYMLRRLTADGGLAEWPAISPDGKYFAFASDRAGGGNLDIWIQAAVGGADPVRLTFGPGNANQPVFSPDGTQLAYHSDESGGGLYMVSTLGGKPRLLASGGRDPHFSPDGQWLAFWTGEVGAAMLRGAAQAMVIPVSGGPARPIAPDLEASAFPIWDPGGQALLCVGRDRRISYGAWYLVDFQKQSSRFTTLMRLAMFPVRKEPKGSNYVTPFAWLPDHTLLYSALQGDATNIWGMRVSADGKQLEVPRRWTGGTALELHGSATITPEQTVSLVYDALDFASAIRSVPLASSGAAAGPPRALLAGYGNVVSPSVSADGSKLAFATLQPNRHIIRVLNVSSGQVDTVTTLPFATVVRPVLSGDGNWVTYTTTHSGYLISSKGGVVETVCSHCGPPTDAGVDGSAMLFESGDTPNELLVCTRQAVPRPIARIVDGPSFSLSAGRWSRDHRRILFCGARDGRKTVYLAPVTADGNVTVSQLVAVSGNGYDAMEPAWSEDGRHVYFVGGPDGFRCIWGRDIDPATGMPVGSIFSVAHFHQAREQVDVHAAYLGEIGLSASRQFLVFGVTLTTGEAWLRTVSSVNRR